MMFMLSAKEKGWDTCPMIGFDAEAVKRILNIDDQFEVVMMITIGKEKREQKTARLPEACEWVCWVYVKGADKNG